jgi:hypothetical protein
VCFATLLIGGSASVASAQTKALDVPEKNIVAAPRGERLLVLLNLQPDRDKLRAMSAEDASGTLIETGKRYASDILNSDRYRGQYKTAEVIFAFVVDMDEYSRPNYGGMVRIGTVSYQREEAGLKVVSTQLDTGVIR